MVPALLQLMPPHRVYVEVFGGSGVFLLNKPHADGELEVYNDLWGDLVNFFRQLRDNTCDLVQALERTMFSREEYVSARDDLHRYHNYGVQVPTKEDQDQQLERARCFFTLARQSFAATAGSGGWRISKKIDPTKSWVNSIEHLPYFAERLRRVVIECQDWKDIIRQYDGLDTFFYCDPPYTMNERSGGTAYHHEMERGDHIILCDLLKRCKAKVVLSGYANPLYDSLLSEWDRHKLNVRTSAANSKTQWDDRREEVIWVKPNSRVQMGMWDQRVEDLLTVEEVEVE
jgi:DNA adenine methylase